MTSINWTNITTVEGLLGAANTTSDGIFWTVAIWFIFLVSLISLVGFGFEVALLGAAFIGLISGIFLYYLGLVGIAFSIGPLLGIILLAFLYIIWNRKD